VILAAAIAALALSTERTAAAPQVQLKLPPPITYERTVGADRMVTFHHETHVVPIRNSCLGCHPEPFRMLHPTRHIVHADMDSGGSCGRCHDGRQAFGVKDSSACQTCHAGRPKATLAGAPGSAGTGGAPAPRVPAPVSFRRGDGSPGTVRFVHESHLKGDASCAGCHPKPFAMKSTGGEPGAMHATAACGGCHDGARAFGVDDAASCARCHRDAEGRP